jgi:HSP20 family molecular chaperone IbpA
MNKTLKITLSTVLLSTITITANVDLEKEMYAPAREMQMLDRAMERGMDEHNQKVQPIVTIIDEGTTMDNSPMVAFQEFDGEYRLTETIDNYKNTEIKVTIEGDSVKIEASTKESQKSNQGAFKEVSSTTTEVISIPFDGDSSKMKKIYRDGVLTITMPKKVRKKW